MENNIYINKSKDSYLKSSLNDYDKKKDNYYVTPQIVFDKETIEQPPVIQDIIDLINEVNSNKSNAEVIKNNKKIFDEIYKSIELNYYEEKGIIESYNTLIDRINVLEAEKTSLAKTLTVLSETIQSSADTESSSTSATDESEPTIEQGMTITLPDELSSNNQFFINEEFMQEILTNLFKAKFDRSPIHGERSIFMDNNIYEYTDDLIWKWSEVELFDGLKFIGPNGYIWIYNNGAWTETEQRATEEEIRLSVGRIMNLPNNTSNIPPS